jgi:phospholipid/cholesterol/gamma-HCH transport system substrate-binding protein
MKNNLIETVMGAVVLAIAAFFLVFAYSSSGLKNNYKSYYTATFDRVDGLQPGSDVRLSGVKVGLISDITVEPRTFMARVTFSLQDDIRLPRDSSAEIVTDGLLGGKYLALVPGGDEEVLAPGSEIAYTQASVSLEAMIGQLIFSKKDESSKKDDSIEKGSVAALPGNTHKNNDQDNKQNNKKSPSSHPPAP